MQTSFGTYHNDMSAGCRHSTSITDINWTVLATADVNFQDEPTDVCLRLIWDYPSYVRCLEGRHLIDVAVTRKVSNDSSNAQLN
jgi:hypothetical protein